MDSDAFKVTGIDPAQEEAKAKKCRRLILLTLLGNEHTHVKLENASIPLLNRVDRQPTLSKVKRKAARPGVGFHCKSRVRRVVTYDQLYDATRISGGRDGESGGSGP